MMCPRAHRQSLPKLESFWPLILGTVPAFNGLFPHGKPGPSQLRGLRCPSALASPSQMSPVLCWVVLYTVLSLSLLECHWLMAVQDYPAPTS